MGIVVVYDFFIFRKVFEFLGLWMIGRKWVDVKFNISWTYIVECMNREVIELFFMEFLDLNFLCFCFLFLY